MDDEFGLLIAGEQFSCADRVLTLLMRAGRFPRAISDHVPDAFLILQDMKYDTS